MTEHDEPAARPPEGAEPDASRSEVPARQVVVGIGASAGGLRALKQFFETVPADSGLAYVVVMHLSAEHESHLADLLQPHAPIPVVQVTGESPLEPNRAYVIPPGRNLSAVDSHLRLAPLQDARTGRAPIDHFFRTLASTYDGSSVGVILSGTGSDGAQGIRYVRDEGGLTIVQDPDEAEFDAMARSAISTGMVDRVLPIAGMVEQILEFARARPRVPPAPHGQRDSEKEEADPLHTVLALVRVRTGHDFLRYKQTTVRRRVARRMQVHNLERLADYLEVLRAEPQETSALLDDLLINVTSFFRDPEVFRTLETDVIPGLFEGKGRGDAVRVWSLGCSTGEEAYSLGILLLEESQRRRNPPLVQVFATDPHERSLRDAREGLFTDGIETDVSPERLERFFRREGDGYRVTKALRDIVVFAAHNLLRDPPFSRMDLIVCRNVLIYLQRDAQDEVIDVFHYALRDGGQLLLGTAETLDRSDLFRIESKDAHLYRRRDVRRGAPRLPAMLLASAPAQQRLAANDALLPPRSQPERGYGALHLQMVERYAPPSILVGPDREVVHLSAHVGRYLQHPGGEPTRDVFKLVREELRAELRTALHTLPGRPTTWRSRPVAMRLDGEARLVTLRVSPADEPGLEGYALVIFDEADGEAAAGATAAEPPIAASSGELREHRELEAELEMTRSRMQALAEEFETSQEEMRAANEELQSANEELRSTMEELETSREELQSVNEELQTVNQENRHKVEELMQLSSDLQNLLQATDVATIFLDRGLRILRYTPRASEIFNVRHTDRGRPLADFSHSLGYGGLIDDARRVLQTLVPTEREVQERGGDFHFVLRITPYRTMDDRIEGVVITIMDVTTLKRAEAALREGEERFRLIVDSALSYAIFSTDLEGRIESWSPGAAVVFGWSAAEAIGRPMEFTFTPEDQAAGQPARERATARQEGFAQDTRWHQRKDGSRAFIEGVTRVFRGANGVERGFVKIGQDVTGRWRMEQELRVSEARWRALGEHVHDHAIYMIGPDGIITEWTRVAERVTGYTAAEAVGQHVSLLYTPEDRAAGAVEREMAEAAEAGRSAREGWRVRRDGSRFWADEVATALYGPGGALIGITKISRDLTERRLAREASERARSAAERDAMRRELAQAEEDERRRLSRELHDEAGQLLTALGLGLRALSDVAQPGSEVDRRTAQLRELANALSRELHAVAVRLRPKALDDFGLEAALGTLAEEWSRQSGVAVDVHTPPEAERLPAAVETALYRIVQEALTNVARHSGATRASVVIERRDGQAIAVVEDNGRGFDASSHEGTPALGLLGIRERATLLGGTLDIETPPDGGTTLFVRIPIPPPAAARPRPGGRDVGSTERHLP